MKSMRIVGKHVLIGGHWSDREHQLLPREAPPRVWQAGRLLPRPAQPRQQAQPQVRRICQRQGMPPHLRTR